MPRAEPPSNWDEAVDVIVVGAGYAGCVAAVAAHDAGAGVSRRQAPGNYPFSGHQTFGFVSIESLPDFEAVRDYPHVSGSPAGARLFRVLEANLEQRGIDIHTSTAAERLFTDAGGNVAGLLAQGSQGSTTI